MAEPYFQTGPGRAAGVRKLFDRIAPCYDLINDVQSVGLHRIWKREVIRQARVNPSSHALDVCCGTGDLTWAFHRAGVKSTGIDFSEPMLDQARARVPKYDVVSGPRFVSGDALNLPFPDASFDIVTMSYGLRNLADLERGLDELDRVLRPGGRLVILDFGRPENRVLRGAYHLYLRMVIPVYGMIFARDAGAYRYILDSLQAYPGQRGVDQRLKQRGFTEVGLIEFFGGTMGLNAATKIGH